MSDYGDYDGDDGDYDGGGDFDGDYGDDEPEEWKEPEDSFEEEPPEEFVTTFAQREQLGRAQEDGVDTIYNSIMSGDTMNGALAKTRYLRMEPLQRFRMLAHIFYQKYGEKTFDVSWSFIEEKIASLRLIRYKNPVAFILGARILDKKGNISKDKLNSLSVLFKSELEREFIGIEDVFRYARLFTSSA